ncbi:uncharacterized protein BXZ73DRAFT_96183 [Epithele typhae]|uniref:uncharacterized protein n=1 Tax=Epithele typhae TaxID=378194 RepID=UPI00200783AB|nr:uncharacterized protein BXZ73DRAFT_96183 [Epithele typhae]KAH9945193.1 hypothetical protein BXZ73DRAFT_96183 [Epithele typhae]
MSASSNLLKLTSGQASSLIAVVLFATISLLAIFAVLLRYSWAPVVERIKGRRSSDSAMAFFNTQLGAYIASLMLSNALSSISFMIDAQWSSDKSIVAGITCNAQGILGQMGDMGGAFFTSAIAIHSFNTLVLRNKLPVWICLAVNVFGWLFAIIMAATPTWVSPVFGPVYGLGGIGCGISTEYPLLGTVLHLIPLLLGSVVSVVFSSLVFLVLRGTLNLKDGFKLNVNRSHRWSMSSVTTVEYERFIATVARSMLWYPFAYNILLLPEIIVMLTQASSINVPFEALVFSGTMASMLGLANSLILINTLRILRPFLEGNLTVGSVGSVDRKSKDSDMESFYAGAKSPAGFSPDTPEKAYTKRESKPEWTPPPRTASSITANVARGINRVSRGLSLKRKESELNPFVEVARPITPVAELNAMLAEPEPAYKRSLPSTPRLRAGAPSTGLPLPRRDTRSPIFRQPTLPTERSPVVEVPFVSVSLNTPEPPKKMVQFAVPASDTSSDNGSRHTSMSESLVSMYLSRTPEAAEMDVPPVPPKKALPEPPKNRRPAQLPLSARPSMSSTLTPSAFPGVRSARLPVITPTEAVASNEWAERVRAAATPTTATLKAERRRSRSLDLNATNGLPRTPARTPMYGDSLTAATPRRDASLSAVSARTATFGARTPSTARPPASARALPLPATPAGSRTPGGYNYL